MIIQLIFFELAIGFIILGALFAYKRSIGERVCLLIATAASYAIAFLVTKLGVFDLLAFVTVKLLCLYERIGGVLSSTLLRSGLQALLATSMRPVLMTGLFLVLCIFFRIVVAIVIKAARLDKRTGLFYMEPKRRSKRKSKGASDGSSEGEPVRKPKGRLVKNLIACLIGAVTCYSFFMLSYLPVAAVENNTKPVVETLKQEQYDGTLVQEVAEIADKHILPTGSRSPFGVLQKYTGVKVILDGTCRSLSAVTVRDDDNKKMTFRADEFWQGLFGCAADGVAIYEFTCHPSESTFENLRPAAHLVETLSEQKLLLKIGLAYLDASKENEKETEAEGITDRLIGLLKDSYSSESVDALSEDLGQVATLIDTVAEDLKDTKLKKDMLIPALLDYLSKEENARGVVDTLSATSIYGDVFDVAAEYGLTLLCDKMDISGNKEESYEDYMDSFYAEANTRTDGDYYTDEVETFIRYAVENGISVSDYRIEDPDNLSAIDFAYNNYLHYCAQSQRIEALFVSYHLDDESAATAYTMSDGTVCVYDKKQDKWSLATEENDLRAGSLAAQLLSVELKDAFGENIELTLSKDDLKLLCAGVITVLEDGTAPASETRREDAASLLRSVLSAESYFPEGVVYRDDVMASLKKGDGLDEKHNESCASILCAAAIFGDSIYGGEKKGIELYIDNFHLIGRLLDDLQSTEKTAEIPEKLLYAIAQHKDYGKYFRSDDIKEMSENAKNGDATYEELFASVQAFYYIANEILPG